MTTMSVYGCGGSGANFIKDFVNLPYDPDAPRFPEVKKYIFDTSDSNVKRLPDDVTPFLIPGLRGAGKVMRNAYHGVNDHITNILNEHKPGDFNIVLSGAGGGSGSVINCLVTSELLRRGANVLVVLVGSTASEKEAVNTLNTLSSLQTMIAEGATNDRPVPFIYLENENKEDEVTINYIQSRPKTDLRVEEVVRQIGLLMSGSHLELDETDLVNWLDYTKASPEIPPQLVEVMAFKQDHGGKIENHGDNIFEYVDEVIGLAGLMNSDADEVPALGQPYAALGYYDKALWGDKEIPNMFFITTTSRIEFIFGAVEQSVNGYARVSEKLSKKQLTGVARSKNGSGMVF